MKRTHMKYQQQGRSKTTWTCKYREPKTYMVRFINRVIEDLYRAYENLKTRYKQVILEKRLVNGLYQGWFTVTN